MRKGAMGADGRCEELGLKGRSIDAEILLDGRIPGRSTVRIGMSAVDQNAVDVEGDLQAILPT